jgi:SAM-dependent methyltransferase
MPKRSLVPPIDIRVGVGPFKNPQLYRTSAKEMVHRLINLCGLRPSEQILDIGCGCGRVAAGLTTYLDRIARYEGFDCEASWIEWCQQSITPRFPHFHFQFVDVVAGAHNPEGKLQAAEFTFPYPADTFDIALASSVFTHMLPGGVEHYVAETARVLKPGGRFLVSHLLFNTEALQAVEEGRTIFDFRCELGPCRTFDPQTPEEGVAYEEGYVRAVFERNGLYVQEPIHYGTWRNKRSYIITHDWIVVRKG